MNSFKGVWGAQICSKTWFVLGAQVQSIWLKSGGAVLCTQPKHGGHEPTPRQQHFGLQEGCTSLRQGWGNAGVDRAPLEQHQIRLEHAIFKQNQLIEQTTHSLEHGRPTILLGSSTRETATSRKPHPDRFPGTSLSRILTSSGRRAFSNTFHYFSGRFSANFHSKTRSYLMDDYNSWSGVTKRAPHPIVLGTKTCHGQLRLLIAIVAMLFQRCQISVFARHTLYPDSIYELHARSPKC